MQPSLGKDDADDHTDAPRRSRGRTCRSHERDSNGGKPPSVGHRASVCARGKLHGAPRRLVSCMGHNCSHPTECGQLCLSPSTRPLLCGSISSRPGKGVGAIRGQGILVSDAVSNHRMCRRSHSYWQIPPWPRYLADIASQTARFASSPATSAFPTAQSISAPYAHHILPLSPHRWNAGGCCPNESKDGVDDVSFTRLLVSVFRARYNLDDSMLFISGVSNGGMMANRLACTVDGVTAFAAVSGPLTNGTSESGESFQCSRKVPFLHTYSRLQ